MSPPNLATLLDGAAPFILHQLSVNPKQFAPLKSDLSGEELRLAHEHLIAAASAYIVAARKELPSRERQRTLGLPSPPRRPVDAPLAVLKKACRSFYLDPVDLSVFLVGNGPSTLDLLKTEPASFGTIKPAHTDRAYAKLHARLLAAAQAYIDAREVSVTRSRA